MKHRHLAMGAVICAWMAGTVVVQLPQSFAENLHFTYLWHLEQPIYWPDQQPTGADRYEDAWTSIQRTDLGAAHPENNLRDIFGWADRVAAYQYRCADAISAISSHAEAGAQISYSGGLIENVASLGAANQLGYGSNWNNSLKAARGWNTVGQSKPRCDIVVFPFHHPLLPLCEDATVRKEIQLYKAVYADAWGSSPGVSKGMFPPEMAFSTRLVQILAEEGIEWVIVSGEHVSRACTDFPTILGTGGINCDPPNAADQLNPAQVNYFRKHIDRGCSPATAMPFGYTPHRVQHIDPNTGQAYNVVAVPAAQALGWDDGYAPLGTGSFNTLNAFNNTSRPMLVLLAHDGDNAWGGGFSYYMEATPNLVNSAQAAGYTATVVEEYLADHPVPPSDIIHVEDGAWVNADGDFGAPQMLNWNWPLVSGGAIDIPGGWAEDERNWAVITAAQNRVETAEQIAGSADINEILYPGPTTSAVERAWHYFLGSLNSGYMYYGTAVDMEVKPTVACNEAVQHADTVIGDGSLDTTPPTIWIPQRHPWNPGSVNFGPQYGYQQFVSNGDFWIWTFAYDVSDIASVTLKYRIDVDGANPLTSSQNETYAGGAEVGAWQSLPMTYRDFPSGNVNNDPSINFFELPQYIADEYYVEVTELREVLIDYYVEAVDGKGNIKRSPIQHVYIGDGVGGGGTGGDVVTVTPDPPQAGQNVTITYDATGRVLDSAGQVYIHYGFNGWDPTISPDAALTWNAVDSVWEITVSVSSSASVLDMVFNDGAGTWDNNNGSDWHVAVEGGEEPQQQWVLDGQLDAAATLIDSNAGMELHAGVTGDQLYLAALDARAGNDHFLLVTDTPGAMGSAPWAKAGQVAGWSAFVGNENDSGWAGWFDQGGSANVTASGGSGYLEATINLADEFGAMPDVVYVAFAAYPTTDGSNLLSTKQVPASVNGDGNVDAAEYIAINTCDIRTDHDTFDLDRNCAFNLADYDVFIACFAGPDNGTAGTCPVDVDSDFDQDGDTDLYDFYLMQPTPFD
ncbi:MAG: hypothetical protein KDA54_00015 [Phycisphaerales bacterium]|nr:hypothetical protein [Phycisphaerales bacterium]